MTYRMVGCLISLTKRVLYVHDPIDQSRVVDTSNDDLKKKKKKKKYIYIKFYTIEIRLS